MKFGRFKSRKNRKRALGVKQYGQEGVIYRYPVQMTNQGHRFVQHGIKKYLLSQGPLQ